MFASAACVDRSLGAGVCVALKTPANRCIKTTESTGTERFLTRDPSTCGLSRRRSRVRAPSAPPLRSMKTGHLVALRVLWQREVRNHPHKVPHKVLVPTRPPTHRITVQISNVPREQSHCFTACDARTERREHHAMRSASERAPACGYSLTRAAAAAPSRMPARSVARAAGAAGSGATADAGAERRGRWVFTARESARRGARQARDRRAGERTRTCDAHSAARRGDR
jgi:hypothetical protein